LKSSSFSADNLLANLNTLSVAGQYYVAYSGGLDSHVLLHALHSLRSELSAEIYALHVNHGIKKEAGEWVLHCEQTCKFLDIELIVLNIGESRPQGESLEAWARQKRYSLFATKLDAEDILLTAHHQDDQAETLLLQLSRGAGVKGLAAMPLLRNRDGMWHARPLLNSSREQLLEYAKLHMLQWIEDGSNNDLDIDRNFFRHEILPGLQQRWPNIAETLCRAANHQAEAMTILDESAETDLQDCLTQAENCLDIEKLLLLSPARQANSIRHWLRQLSLPIPDTKLMQEILNKLLPAKIDAEPIVRWPGTEIRRYQQHLYASEPFPVHDSEMKLDWNLNSVCELGDGVLSASLGHGLGIKTDICRDNQVQIRYRRGGEKIKLFNKKHHQELKKLFQETGIPPWIRDRIPLLYKDDKLIAVANLWIDVTACSTKDETAWQIDWNWSNWQNSNIGEKNGN
jgi:tRNA(Ile)-lysidine synthase